MHNRFFCPSENIGDKNIIVSDRKEIHHIVDVLRLGIGSEIVIFDGKGNEFQGIINVITKNRLDISIKRSSKSMQKPFHITLACAIPKKAKFDFIVEKTTELGIDKIIPLETERTEVKFSKERAISKVKHYREIAVNASKQSQRSFIPEIEELNNFKKAATEIKNYDLALLPTLQGNRISLAEAVHLFKGKTIIIFIGPEGDFSEEEVNLTKTYGCKLVTLGENVLKVDTAAISVIAVLNHLLDAKK